MQNFRDTGIQAEVVKYFGGVEDAGTIYEAFIPAA